MDTLAVYKHACNRQELAKPAVKLVFSNNSIHTCRPVTSDMVDDQMPLIGIPSFIKPAGASAATCTHYFVSVRPTDCDQPTLPGGDPDTAAPAAASELPRTTTLAKRTPSVHNRSTAQLSVHDMSHVMLGHSTQRSSGTARMNPGMWHLVAAQHDLRSPMGGCRHSACFSLDECASCFQQ